MDTAISYTLVFLYGAVVGSFLNVCIYRIPNHESIITKRSHCPRCGGQLTWRDLIPLLSWVWLRGRCRQCKGRISMQYPLVELANALLWVATCGVHGPTIKTLIYCLFISALLILSVIDARTMEIPFGINVFIFILGAINLAMNYKDFVTYVIGLFLVSGLFYAIYVITRGNGIGGGDIYLMAAAGLLLGYRYIFFAMMLGCLYAVAIHLVRMKVSKVGHKLAMGPYLSAGMVTMVWFGGRLLEWYAGLV